MWFMGLLGRGQWYIEKFHGLLRSVMEVSGGELMLNVYDIGVECMVRWL